MQAAKTELFKASSLDIVVTRLDLNGLYNVTGKDAAKFHAKLRQLPAESQDLEIGELKDGAFTLKKPVCADSAAKTTARAG